MARRLPHMRARTVWILAAVVAGVALAIGLPVGLIRARDNRRLMRDVALIRERRVEAIIGASSGSEIQLASNVSSWMSSLSSDGKWPDSEVNYTAGCGAQRANWPASEHWTRILTLATAYRGPTPGGQSYIGNVDVQKTISKAMDWWFSHDFTASDCLYNGGKDGNCPCDTPGLWNSNWHPNIILVPSLIAQACLVLRDTLSATQQDGCSRVATRSYSVFYDKKPQGFMAGANILDIAKIGIDQAVRVSNEKLVKEAYGRTHEQLVVEPDLRSDGIKPDGSFGQHLGLMYNGNYGTVFSNAVLSLEQAAAGTRYAANKQQVAAFSSLFDGNKWMIFYNTVTGVLHWDYSALPRFITFPVADDQPSGSIMTNLTQVQDVGDKWSSSTLQQYASSLNGKFSSANAGKLVGNRMFYSNDYMVHRGENYVSTLKMYSSRTKNTEWTNSQNPYGFHLADGALYTYVNGNEYEDIAASWDWDKIPGITTDYNATVLEGDSARQDGVESFVGGASTGSVGVAAMRYTNPSTKNFEFQKAWFFLDDNVQHILISSVSSKNSAPVLSILDQKRRSGPVMLSTSPTGALSEATSNSTKPVHALWNANVGYVFDRTFNSTEPSVFFQTGNRTGSWQSIGTSTQPPSTVDIFSAWIQHKQIIDKVTRSTAGYTVFPGVDAAGFESKRASTKLRTLRNEGHVSAVADDVHKTFMAVFWDAAGGSVQLSNETSIVASAASVLIYREVEGTITVADPSQSITTMTVKIIRSGAEKTITFTLPSGPGGTAGSSVTKSV